MHAPRNLNPHTLTHASLNPQGNLLDPLAQLAAEQLGGAAGAGGDGDEEAAEGQARAAAGEGLYIVGDRPEDRFKRAADLMRQRDKLDRARLKQLKKVGGVRLGVRLCVHCWGVSAVCTLLLCLRAVVGNHAGSMGLHQGFWPSAKAAGWCRTLGTTMRLVHALAPSVSDPGKVVLHAIL